MSISPDCNSKRGVTSSAAGNESSAKNRAKELICLIKKTKMEMQKLKQVLDGEVSKIRPSGDAAGNNPGDPDVSRRPVLKYDREFLFRCADSPFSKQNPPGLEQMLELVPIMNPKIQRDQNNNFQGVGQHPLPHPYNPTKPPPNKAAAHVNNLFNRIDPLRPNVPVQVFDPVLGQWVVQSASN